MLNRSALPALDARRHIERARLSRLILSREIALAKMLAKTIAYLGRKAADQFRHVGKMVGPLGFSNGIAHVLRPSIRNTVLTFADQVVRKSLDFGGKSHNALETKLFETLDAEIERFIAEHTAERVVQISDSLKQQIAGIVRRGLQEGQSSEQIASAIVQATSGEMAKARARRIAQTETHTAAQVGQYAAARGSPFKFRKQWLATEDKRTRPAHAEANGQTRDLDEPFVVGGEELMFPGDPKGSAGNVINCRCVVLYEPIAAAKPEQPEDAQPIEPNDLLQNVDVWRAWFDQLREAQTVPNDVTLYCTGPDVGLPQFMSVEEAEAEVGQNIAPPRTASINPVQVNMGAGLQDTLPLRGRPVVVKIKVPAGTPAESGAELAMEVRLASSVRIVITAASGDRWGEIQDDAGVPVDSNPPRRAYRRMPPRRGVTLVEAEVQP